MPVEAGTEDCCPSRGLARTRTANYGSPGVYGGPRTVKHGYSGGQPGAYLDSSDASGHSPGWPSRRFSVEASSSPQRFLLFHGPTRGPLSATPPRLPAPYSPAPTAAGWGRLGKVWVPSPTAPWSHGGRIQNCIGTSGWEPLRLPLLFCPTLRLFFVSGICSRLSPLSLPSSELSNRSQGSWPWGVKPSCDVTVLQP